MPWDHCSATAIPDDASCPECDIAKADWTVEFELTRSFKVQRRPTYRVRVLDDAEQGVAGLRLRLEPEGGDPVEAELDEAGFWKLPREADEEGEVVFPGVAPGALRPRDDAESGGDEAGPAAGDGGDAAGAESAEDESGEGGDAEPTEARFACSTRRKLELRLERWLSLRLTRLGAPWGEVAYRLELPSGETRDGQADAEGHVRELLPADAERVVLCVGEPEERHPIEVGPLPGVEDPVGAQLRLNHLGYRCGPPDGELGPRAQAALRRFQRAEELEPSGELDDATAERLVAVHGF